VNTLCINAQFDIENINLWTRGPQKRTNFRMMRN